MEFVDPLAIIQEHDITVSFNDYGTYFDGLLHCKEGRFHIYCNLGGNNKSSEGRQRFTLAHELGHFIIPEHHSALRSGEAPHHPSFCSQDNSEIYVELEADFFASRLLMPERRMKEKTKKNGWDLEGIRRTATELKTSLLSTVLRFSESNDYDCAFVIWRENRKPWFSVSNAFRNRGLSFLRTNKDEVVQPETATAAAFKDSGGQLNKIHSSISVSEFWFGASKGPEGVLTLKEEAIKTSYGVITWLTIHPAKETGRSAS
jgi:Zn-dependent peptidase ImmA (M78 family)